MTKRFSLEGRVALATWGAELDEFADSGWDTVMDLNLKSPFVFNTSAA